MLGGAVGHVSADGLLPGAPVLAGLSVVTLVLCAALLHRPASRRRVVALLVAGQTAVHLARTVTAGHVGDQTATAAHPVGTGALPVIDGRRVGSLMDSYDAAVGGCAATPVLPVGHLVSDLSDLSAHAPMMLAHLAAAALVGLWLAAGERALWSLVAMASRAALGPLAVASAAARAVVASPAAAVPVATEARPPQVPVLLARVVVRRGPPALLAA